MGNQVLRPVFCAATAGEGGAVAQHGEPTGPLPLILWPVFLAAYLVFAGSFAGTEIAAGGVLSALASVLVRCWERVDCRAFRFGGIAPGIPWFHVVGKPLGALLTDTVRVGRVLAGAIVRRPAGRAGSVLVQPFRHGNPTPDDNARRGLVTLALSFAPNGYVLDVPDGSDTLILHQLHPTAASPDRIWP